LMEYAYDVKYAPYPNPYVGCAIIVDGIVRGLGRCGDDEKHHAELQAINSYSSTPPVTTSGKPHEVQVYVTLEPCVLFEGKRTPSCAQQLMEWLQSITYNAMDVKVYIGMLDVDERVNGKGVHYLQTHGLDVIVMNHPKVLEVMREYIHHRTTHTPYVIGKLALTLDHKYTLDTEFRAYISSASALHDVHHTRRRVQAIVTTERTLAVDNPRLTCRYYPDEEKRMDIYVLRSRAVTIEDTVGSNVVSVLTELGPTSLTGLIKEQKVHEFHLYIDARLSSAASSTAQVVDLHALTQHLTLKSIQVFDSTVKYVYVHEKLGCK
jgi:pyrimidine deaminase RibD-like protein/riboflavin biosynthesis pyrimidine reductase